MGSLYVGDLRADVDEFDLLHIFNAVGKISSVHVCRDTATETSLGYAYVNYCELKSAENALLQLNYLNIKGRSCRVMWSHHAKESKITEDGNVFVKNLHKLIGNKDLHEIFSAFGKIISCKVATNEQQQSLGYGYVHFERTVDAVKAIKKANRMSINGRELHVEYFVSKGERKERNTTKNPQHFPHFNQTQENRTNLYVNGLDTTITNVILEDLFLRFGEITSAKIERDQYNKSRKFGFVCFRNPNAAAKAIEEMNGALIGDKCIYVGYAQKKSERKEFLSQQFNTNRQSPAKYTPNPEITHRKPYLADSQPKYCLPKRHSFCSSTNDNLTNNQGPIKTRSATNTTSIRSSADVRTAKTPLTRNTEATIQLDVGTDTDTRIGKVPRPISLISNELPLRQRNIMRSSSSERLSNYLSSVKIRSVPSSPTREFSQNFTFDQQIKDLHPLTPNSSFQASNVEVRAKNKFERKTQPRELVSPQKSECVENTQDLISRFDTKSKDPIFSTKLPSGGTCSRKPVPNHEDYGWRPKIVDEKKHEMGRLNSQELPRNSRIQLVKNTQDNTLKHFNKDQERNKRQNRVENKHQTQIHPETMQIDVCMSRKFVEDKIYDTARREHPNEANLIVGLITEKCTKEQLQLIATSDVLMDHEVEKARSKIRRLETPMCQNYL